MGARSSAKVTCGSAALCILETADSGIMTRMRNATICVVQLRGTATETIKNIVLAGIGKLILVDGGEISEEDLGAGFFFRDGDVGKKVRRSSPPRREAMVKKPSSPARRCADPLPFAVRIINGLSSVVAASPCCKGADREPQPSGDRRSHRGRRCPGRRRTARLTRKGGRPCLRHRLQ